MGEKTKIEDRGSKIEWVSIRLAILDHPSSILKPSPTRPTSHTLEKDIYFSGMALVDAKVDQRLVAVALGIAIHARKLVAPSVDHRRGAGT